MSLIQHDPASEFLNWGSNASDDADSLVWDEGYLIDDQAGDFENMKGCAFLRAQSYRRRLSAVLFAVSDVDHPSLEDRSSSCRGVPGEVTTILGRLGDLFKGGRFIWRDRSNSVRVPRLDGPKFCGQ
jgi:hypothetical protein